MQKILVLFNLKPGADPAAYEDWARKVDLPTARGLNAVTQFEVYRSEGLMGTVNVVMYPFPEWRVSPYFTIGTGIIHTEPQTTVIQAEDRTDEVVNAGLGANIYLTRRFVMNFEYRRHTVLSSRDDNQEINEWKTGFSVFLGKH